jgi:hypothetical protein
VTQGPPAWHPDPSGRHQFRWWDGLGYTDQVADSGVVSTDANATPLTSSTPDKPSRAIAVVLGIFLVLLLAGVAAYFIVGGSDDGHGTGTFDGAIDGNDHVVGIHDVSLRGVSALTVDLDPDRGLDAVVGLVVSRDDARKIEDLYSDIGGPDASSVREAFDGADVGAVDSLTSDDQVVFRTDVGFAGDDEQVLLVVPFDVDVRVVVAPFDDTQDGEGEYSVEIQSFSLDGDENDDATDLLDAVTEDHDIPRDFRDLAEEQLAFS